jgi:hypothetical protein
LLRVTQENLVATTPGTAINYVLDDDGLVSGIETTLGNMAIGLDSATGRYDNSSLGTSTTLQTTTKPQGS